MLPDLLYQKARKVFTVQAINLCDTIMLIASISTAKGAEKTQPGYGVVPL